MANPHVTSGSYDFRKGKPKPGPKELRSIEIERSANGGYVAQHRFHSGEGAYHEPETHTFGEGQGAELMAHLGEHLGIKANPKAGEEEY